VTATVNSQQQLLAGLVTDGGELSQIFGRIVAPDGTTTWAVAQHDGDSWQLWAAHSSNVRRIFWGHSCKPALAASELHYK
jgi:hypothetical protein